jgi:hypothetical protein
VPSDTTALFITIFNLCCQPGTRQHSKGSTPKISTMSCLLAPFDCMGARNAVQGHSHLIVRGEWFLWSRILTRTAPVLDNFHRNTHTTQSPFLKAVKKENRCTPHVLPQIRITSAGSWKRWRLSYFALHDAQIQLVERRNSKPLLPIAVQGEHSFFHQ